MKHKGYNIVATGSTIGQRFKYNSKEYEKALSLNLYEYGARNYDAALGRWINVDPLSEVSRRWSPYTYCYNNPMRFIDPDGMMAIESDDIFQVDREGKIEQIEAEGDDVLVNVNRMGEEIGQRVNIGTDAELIDDGKVQTLKIPDQSKAKEAFKEIADNTTREFSLINMVHKESGDKNSAIVGDGERRSSSGDIVAERDFQRFGQAITEITHNHPLNSTPSGYDPEAKKVFNRATPIGDAVNATDWPTNTSNEPIVRKVYNSQTGKVYRYDDKQFYPAEDY